MHLKSFRKIIIGLIAIWLILVVFGVIFSRSFQKKIIDVLSEQVDKHIAAEVHIRKSNIHFSIFKKFPLASVELRNIMVKTPRIVDLTQLNTMHGDTLLFAEKLYLQLNLWSILKNDYQLQKISVNKGFIQVLTDSKGNSSLNIFKPSNSNKAFEANIKSFSLTGVEVFTYIAQSKFQSLVDVKKGEVSGTFTNTNFAVEIKSNGLIEELVVQGERLKPRQTYKIDVAINRLDKTYTIQKGYYAISNIPMKVIGNIKSGTNTHIDLIFSAQNASLKQIDKSFLAGILGKTGFELKGGKLSLQSTIKGYIKKSTPAVSIVFKINDGRVLDSDKNISYNNIFLMGNISNGHTQQFQKSFCLCVDTFRIETGKSTQFGNLKIDNLKLPNISANMHGVIDIKDFTKYLPNSNVKIRQGIIRDNIRIKGLLPQGEKNKSDLKLNGEFELSNLHVNFEKGNLPLLTVDGTISIDNDKTLLFDSLYCRTENSDLRFDGSLYYLLSKSKIPKYTGSVSSVNLFMSDFITIDPNSTKTKDAILFPDSIEANGNIAIQNFYFGKFSPQNIKADIAYKNKNLKVESFVMNTFSGSVSGNVQIGQTNSINLSANVFLRRNKLEEMFNGFNNFGQKVISSEHLNGLISGTIQYKSSWSNTLKIDKASIFALGNILLEDGELNEYPPLLGLSKFIEVEELKHIKFDNLSTNINIHNRKVLLDQTHIASSVISFDGSGVHDFDNKYEYRLQVALSDLLLKKAHKKRSNISEFGYIIDDNSGRTTVPFLITGKGTSFEVKYDKRTSRKSFKEKVQLEKQELKELFNNKPKPTEIEEKSVPETIKEEEKPELKKTDSGTYQNKTDDFILDWDDSEELNDNN